MTQPTRAKAGRRSRRSASQLFIAALVVFGIAASVLLLFSENVQWLRVGLVSALWAAIVGAFAMTKYRRDAAADQTKAKDLQTVYELQLAREISARREYELGVEARVRSEVQIETSEVAALRAELAHLRENLQVLFDGNLPTERVALRAEATRMQELGGRRTYDSYQPAPSGLYVPGRSPQSGAGNGRSADESQVPSSADSSVAGIATPYDEPVTAETSVLFPDAPIGDEPQAGSPRVYESRRAETRAPGAGRRTPTPPRAPAEPDRPQREEWFGESAAETYSFGQSSDYAGSAPTPQSSPNPESSFEAPVAAEPAPPIYPPETPADSRADFGIPPTPGRAAQVPASEPPAPEASKAQLPPVDEPAADESPAWDLPESRPRRRRRAEQEDDGSSGAHSNGRSVAEILAGMQTGDSGTSERRHRRRAD
nr:DUF6779 domain-containing protein [Rhodococcus sp. (in: high G+C Gram-positive bacteria)]